MGSSQISVLQAIALISPRKEEKEQGFSGFYDALVHLPAPSPYVYVGMFVCVWQCVYVCVLICVWMCVCICEYACMCICVWIWMCVLDTSSFLCTLVLVLLYRRSRSLFSLLSPLLFPILWERQLKCQAFSDVCLLVHYGKGDMSGGGGVKWNSVPTVLLQERWTNTIRVLISLICGVTERCRAGAGVQSSTFCQIQIFSEFDYWCPSTGKCRICVDPEFQK